MTSTEAVVVHETARRRFEIRLDAVAVGFTAYLDADEQQRIFYHTEIGDEFGGRGLAGTLVREALTATRDAGRRIVPVCPYVKKWLSSHAAEAGLADVVDRVTAEAVAAAGQAMSGRRGW